MIYRLTFKCPHCSRSHVERGEIDYIWSAMSQALFQGAVIMTVAREDILQNIAIDRFDEAVGDIDPADFVNIDDIFKHS